MTPVMPTNYSNLRTAAECGRLMGLAARSGGLTLAPERPLLDEMRGPLSRAAEADGLDTEDDAVWDALVVGFVMGLAGTAGTAAALNAMYGALLA